MPTPIGLLLDPVSLAVIALYAAVIVWEAVAPAQGFYDGAPARVGAMPAFRDVSIPHATHASGLSPDVATATPGER